MKKSLFGVLWVLVLMAMVVAAPVMVQARPVVTDTAAILAVHQLAAPVFADARITAVHAAPPTTTSGFTVAGIIATPYRILDLHGTTISPHTALTTKAWTTTYTADLQPATPVWTQKTRPLHQTGILGEPAYRQAPQAIAVQFPLGTTRR